MRIEIVGHNLPGRRWYGNDGAPMDNVHVGAQVGLAPSGLVRADAAEARWQLDATVVEHDDGHDFKGPAVHGRRGARFLYLTWGNVEEDGSFAMFRRAKLMLDRIPEPMFAEASGARDGGLVSAVDLTDEAGGPRCARIDPPHLVWSVG